MGHIVNKVISTSHKWLANGRHVYVNDSSGARIVISIIISHLFQPHRADQMLRHHKMGQQMLSIDLV